MKKLKNRFIHWLTSPQAPHLNRPVSLAMAAMVLGLAAGPSLVQASEAKNSPKGTAPKASDQSFVIYSKRTALADITVKGKVTSATGEPLIGVTIILRGTTKVAVTDVEGNFSMVVPEDGVLEVSYVGFDKQEIRVGGRTEINIEMKSTTALEEVVVVGYGTVAKSDFTGSSSTVKMENTNDNRILSVPEAIQGRVAGVQIMNNTGQPGSGMTFNIRGMTSVTGSSQPLIVIDGQPIESDMGSTMAGTAMDGGNDIPPADPLASLNPDDIESIEILKDASSTAIYGSRGANGVVMITTKSGKEGRDKISFTSRFDLNMLPKKLDVLSTREYMHFRNEAALNDGKDSVYTYSQMAEQLLKPTVDWQDEVYDKPINQTYQLTFSGKDEKSNYLVSGNYTNQKAILKNADYIRYGLRVNYSRKVAKKITLGIKTYFSIADRNYGQESNWTGILGSSAVMGALSFNPLRVPYIINEEGEAELDENFVNSPLVVTTLVKDKTQIRTLISSVSLDYQITKNLKYTMRGGVNDLYSLRHIYNPTGTFIGDTAPDGSATRADNSNSNYSINHILTFAKTFARQHKFDVMAAYEYQKWFSRSSSNTSMTFPSDALTYYSLQSATNPGRMYTSTPPNRALESYLGRLQYTFDRRYLLTLTGRYDGASRLAEGKQWALFPSIGLGWNVSNEDFFKNNVISFLKLKGSIGVAGNQNIGAGATRAKYGLNYTVVGNEIKPGFVPVNFDNPRLKWETTTQYNAGAEVGVFNDRLTFDVDVYRKNTKDLLINLPLPASAGYGSYATNIGEVMNQGIDIEGNLKVLQSGDSRLDIGANFSTFENKVLDLGPASIIYGRTYFVGGAVLLDQAAHVARPGDPISSFWGYKTAGIYQNYAEIENDPALANDNARSIYQPGDVKWVDTNGDGQISDSDKTIIGNPSPDFTYGINGSFSYKRLSISMNIFGSYGNELINMTRWIVGINNTNGNYNQLQATYDQRWRGEGTSNVWPRATTNTVRSYQRLPDWLVEDASFIRLQSVNVGYIFPLPTKSPVRSFRVWVSGTNLYTITKYSGYDPNINAFGHLALNRGVDLGTMGQPRTFSTGVELNF